MLLRTRNPQKSWIKGVITLYQIKTIHSSKFLKTSKDSIKKIKDKNERLKTIFTKNMSDKISVSNIKELPLLNNKKTNNQVKIGKNLNQYFPIKDICWQKIHENMVRIIYSSEKYKLKPCLIILHLYENDFKNRQY